MARYATRYKDQEVIIKDTSSEHPWIGTVKKLYKEGDSLFYEIQVDGEDEPVTLAQNYVEWMRAKREVKVIELKSLNLSPLRLLKSSSN